MKKNKLIIVASSIIGLLVLLLIVLWLLSIFNHKYYTYEEVEAKMVSATEKFYKNNPDILPVNDGKTILPYNTLVENKFIEPLNEILKDGDTCSAEVNVIKNDNNYSYIPKLTCSDKYSTIELAQHILNNNEVVSEGSGLYSDGKGGYYFRGKVNNNYITLGSFQGSNNKSDIPLLWQIISITSDNRIKIRALHYAQKVSYDTRYNETKNINVGYNDFEMSILKEKLKEIENDESFLTNDQKSKLVKSKLCINKRSSSDTSRDGSTECAILSEDEYLFGLMYPYEFIRASIDNNCKNMYDLSCQNFNILSGDGFGSFWTITSNPSNDYEAYACDGYTFFPSYANRERALYLTSYVNPYALFKSGEGTRDNPYVIK